MHGGPEASTYHIDGRPQLPGIASSLNPPSSPRQALDPEYKFAVVAAPYATELLNLQASGRRPRTAAATGAAWLRCRCA